MAHAHLTRTLVVAAAFTAAACGGMPTGPTGPPPPSAAEATRAYLESIIGIMRESSVKRLTIDWDNFTGRVLAAAADAKTVPETFPAIRLALELLGDGHSSYRAASGTTIFVGLKRCSASGAGVPAVPSDIGYVKVTAFSGSGDEAVNFATSIQTAIRTADRDGLAGWVVDLRGNGGGNMWPMIAGVGPVLGDGRAGHFINPNGFTTPWGYENGASTSGPAAVVRVTSPYRLRHPNPRVAVLVDNGVASSGEATFISFLARPDTRTFGVPTCGLSTANRGFDLSDGALLNLTVSTMADRTRQMYGDQVVPDEVIAGTDEVVSRAIGWLRER
jgi:C-terminal processing protease CtpA/Prc